MNQSLETQSFIGRLAHLRPQTKLRLLEDALQRVQVEPDGLHMHNQATIQDILLVLLMCRVFPVNGILGGESDPNSTNNGWQFFTVEWADEPNRILELNPTPATELLTLSKI